jgi:pre-mRNA-processing factor SLU7
VKLAQTQLFAWEAHEKGVNIPEHQLHPQATPSAAEFMRQQYEEKKAKLLEDKRRAIVATYGEQRQAPPKELLLAASETYVEYACDGRILKGVEKSVAKSKYVEDVLENNHTMVWGSWYDKVDRSWGFGCCRSKVRKSYCIGAAGKAAACEASEGNNHHRMIEHQLSGEKREELMLVPPDKNPKSSHSLTSNALETSGFTLTARSALFGENTAPVLDAAKLKRAKEKAKKNEEKKAAAEAQAVHLHETNKKRKYTSIHHDDVNAEDMEIYRMQKGRREDPMANISSDSLLPEK